MHHLSSVYFVNQPAYVSGIIVAHHQEVYCMYICIYIYIATDTFCGVQLTVCWPANGQSTEHHNTYQLLYIYSILPDDGLQKCPKHVEVDWRNKLRINGASSWFSLHSSVVTSPLAKKTIKLKRCFLQNIYFDLARKKISLVAIKLYSQQGTKSFKKLDPLNKFLLMARQL